MIVDTDVVTTYVPMVMVPDSADCTAGSVGLAMIAVVSVTGSFEHDLWSTYGSWTSLG